MDKNIKLKNCIKNLSKNPGVYIYRSKFGKVIYVGKAVNLKNRVSSYFHPTSLKLRRTMDPKTYELVKNIAKIDTIEVGSEFEALVLEAELIKRYRPKYNIDWKDDKNYAYIKFSGDRYPRVLVVHQITDHPTSLELRRTGTKHIGPFVDVKAMRTILKLARRVFPYCTCGLQDNEVCLYYHLGLCKGHGAKYLSEKEYAKNLKGLTSLFSGKTENLRKELAKEMGKASRGQKFEKAAELRDKLHYLKRIQRTHLFSDRDLSSDVGLSELAKHLGLLKIPQKIESFDISNILGTAATGSMVVFRGGIASPKDYRRFQIKTVKGANDVAMMAEVLARRFAKAVIARRGTTWQSQKNSHSEFISESQEIPKQVRDDRKRRGDKAFSDIPDLIILDGGKGQLSAVIKRIGQPENIRIVALAKKHETLYSIRNSKFEIQNLPKDCEAMYLVQRIRDEAHRFAVSYHRKLKSKEIFETSLDGIIGVGPKTKKKLILKYGSVKKIKETSLDDLAKTIGEKLARRIKEGL